MATFHPFPRLPYELRMQIWEMTVESRIVDVKVYYDPIPNDFGLSTTTLVPPVLQACQEARNHGLYKRCFSELALPNYRAQYVWADLNIDTIDIGDTYFERYEKVAKSIRYLKFAREMQSEYFYHSETHDISHFVNAKEIWIVPLDGLGCCVGAGEEHYWPCGPENLFYIDPENPERVFRGWDGEVEIDALYA
ncbi:hypothetical protein BKA58DRAFT_444296 [Alternaria rosae]|uniref:uncharacterized protein n=1 Tax=Alternaria rosae TaxID=1187941 RepID=UPI001E8E20B0|nr:uncharacterized protein BKA58DRAFT_444296 [Alternaria rosae]KAH6859129.1 hypothetical protein BKA58DRAFT_444296 [Alternaria rosae]